ncbi:MAG: hypothetical protein KIIPBIDF_00847 [Candidatus Methanoperedenaceae archaeon GB50]|nr:MAG: hypothetical protein KIIPBIDF_00847 [Candidatus Methanoperedenaceae archaeon GB50]
MVIFLFPEKKALQILTWEKIAKLYEKGAPIRGEITARVKGGFTVDIGIPAFLPGSPSRYQTCP